MYYYGYFLGSLSFCIHVLRFNLCVLKKIRHESYDPINIETIGDNSSWILEDSPSLLTNKEVEALHNDLTNMTI